jgi:hypothetical protein
MKKFKLAAMAMMLCCTPIVNAENNDSTTVSYNGNDGVNVETLIANNKRQLEQRDIRYYEVVDTVYTIVFEGNKLSYLPDECVLVKDGELPISLRRKTLPPGMFCTLPTMKTACWSKLLLIACIWTLRSLCMLSL